MLSLAVQACASSAAASPSRAHHRSAPACCSSGRSRSAVPQPRGQLVRSLEVLVREPFRSGTRLCAGGEIVEVKELNGIRVLKNEDDTPRVEYLVKWKDGSPDTWEPAANLADNLLRDYEQQWWSSVKKGDEAALNAMMNGGGPALARTCDENRRSALHFAAALNKPALVARLVAEGAEVNLADREGYTPLHMAAGYLHTATIGALLAAGADPEQADRAGRSPLALVEGFRAALPANQPETMARRLAVEEVVKVLIDNLFEDVEPADVLAARDAVDGSGREYLVQYADEAEPEWLPAKAVSAEVIEDFESGLEYSDAACIVKMRQRGTARAYLVRWEDGSPDSWEPEEHVSPDLIAAFDAEQRQQQQAELQGAQQAGALQRAGA